MKSLGVVGGGLMGSGIAEVSARAGQDVVVVESSADAAKAALGRLEKSLQRAEAKGKIPSAEEVLGRIRVVTDLDAMADREVVVEAIVEDETAQDGGVRSLDKLVTRRTRSSRPTPPRSRS